MVVVHEHVRDTILSTAAVIADGFDADQVGIVFECYSTVVDLEHPELAGINPLTGRQYRQHEMAELATHHDGIAKGWVEETIAVLVGNRAGDVAMLQQPFHYVGGKHLVWGEAREFATLLAHTPAGVMPEAMRRMMTAPTLSQHIPADFPVDQIDRDAIIGEMLTRRGNAVLLYADSTDPQRVARLQKRFPFGRMNF